MDKGKITIDIERIGSSVTMKFRGDKIIDGQNLIDIILFMLPRAIREFAENTAEGKNDVYDKIIQGVIKELQAE